MRTIYEAKLLLIDDNPDLIQLLCEQLNHAGYTWIQTASNCEDARTAFSKQRPDCMITEMDFLFFGNCARRQIFPPYSSQHEMPMPTGCLVSVWVQMTI